MRKKMPPSWYFFMGKGAPKALKWELKSGNIIKLLLLLRSKTLSFLRVASPKKGRGMLPSRPVCWCCLGSGRQDSFFHPQKAVLSLHPTTVSHSNRSAPPHRYAIHDVFVDLKRRERKEVGWQLQLWGRDIIWDLKVKLERITEAK